MATNKVKDSYTGNDMEVLDGLTAIRLRPGMYIGSQDNPNHMFVEVFSNALDEAVAGFCTRIEVRIGKDKSIEVRDNGRGIPTDINSNNGLSGLEISFMKMHGGSKFGQGTYKTSSGLHGLGLKIVAALSSAAEAHVYRDGKIYSLHMSQGQAGFVDAKGKFTPVTDGQSAMTEAPDKRPAADKKLYATGTVIKWRPDPEIFASIEADYKAFRDEMEANSYMVPSCSFLIEDESTGEAAEFCHTGGLRDMVEDMAGEATLMKPLCFKDEGKYSSKVPVVKNGVVVGHKEEEKGMAVDVSMVWTGGFEPQIRGYANTVYNKYNGTHVDGFRRGVSRALSEYVNSTNLLNKDEKAPNIDDCCSGLCAVVSVFIEDVKFIGQTKDELANQEAVSVVSNIVKSRVSDWLNDKKNATTAKKVAKKIVEEMRYRMREKEERTLQKRKSEIEKASVLPVKLTDCLEVGSEFSELLICEGDSAVGTLKAARDSRYQALLPLRGKIKNVQGKTMSTVLASDTCTDIIKAVGGGSGRSFDPEGARYRNVIIATDADDDGKHIECLLITFFYHYMRPLVEEGRLYVAIPPLYAIKTTGKEPQTIYAADEKDCERILKDLDKKKVKYLPLQRFKGLGEMDPDQFWDTTLNPETRTVKRVKADDAKAADAMLDLAMGSSANSAEKRRNWIVSELKGYTAQGRDGEVA